MLTRHLNELMRRLEHVMNIGFAEIRYSELKLWYGQERITIKVWRDIADRWTEVTDDPKHTLFLAENDGGYAFIWGEGLKATDDAWYMPISSYTTKRKDEDD